MTREEILGLSKLTEAEQEGQLEKAGILESYVCCSCGTKLPESLADCAGRLWGKANNEYYQRLLEAMVLVFDKSGVLSSFQGFWMCDALPIHRIQAVLLAGEGK